MRLDVLFCAVGLALSMGSGSLFAEFEDVFVAPDVDGLATVLSLDEVMPMSVDDSTDVDSGVVSSDNSISGSLGIGSATDNPYGASGSVDGQTYSLVFDNVSITSATSLVLTISLSETQWYDFMADYNVGSYFSFDLDGLTGSATVDLTVIFESSFVEVEGGDEVAHSQTLVTTQVVFTDGVASLDDIPEPSTTTLSFLALAALCYRRKRAV